MDNASVSSNDNGILAVEKKGISIDSFVYVILVLFVLSICKLTIWYFFFVEHYTSNNFNGMVTLIDLFDVVKHTHTLTRLMIVGHHINYLSTKKK